MPGAPLVLQAERGCSIVETGDAQKDDFRPHGDLPQGLCDLFGFSMLLKTPVQIDHPLVLGGFKRLTVNKADEIVAQLLKSIGLSYPDDDRAMTENLGS